MPVQIALGMWRERWNNRSGFGTKSCVSRCSPRRSVVVMAETTTKVTKTAASTVVKNKTKAATPWGSATLVEELRLPQQAGTKRFASLVQLLEDENGERLVRFAYATDGVARRGPVTLRSRDLERLRAGLAKCPGLGEALRL